MKHAELIDIIVNVINELHDQWIAEFERNKHTLCSFRLEQIETCQFYWAEIVNDLLDV